MPTQNGLSWNALFLQGSVVSLSTSLWRARVQLKAQDLGIEANSDVEAALSLGCHRLAPPKAFEAILEPCREAGRVIDYYSINFGLIKGARYVPEKNIAVLTARLAELKTAFDLAVEGFMTNYEATKTAMLPVIERALVAAAKDADSAANAFQRIQAEYPSPSEARARFALSWSVYSIKSAKSSENHAFAEQETQQVKSIIGDMVKQLRDDMAGKIQAILKIATNGGKIHQKSIDACTACLDRVESLNILGDETLKDQIGAFRKVLAGISDGVGAAGMVEGLNQIQTNLEASVQEAIEAAEQSLTGVGRRRFAVDETETPAPAPIANGKDTYAGL